MEEIVPLTMTDASMRAPEEIGSKMQKLKTHEELDREERQAVRRNKKTARRNDVKKKLASGILRRCRVASLFACLL